MPNIEEQLRRAIEEGKFDNLPGKGKPLHLDDTNPYGDADWELAYQILKESGYTLPWIETLHEIENDIDVALKELIRAWKWRMIYLSADVPEVKPPSNGSAPNPPSRRSSRRSTSASVITTFKYLTPVSRGQC